MTVTVRFEAQLRHAAGCEQICISTGQGANILLLFSNLVDQVSGQLAERLIDRAGVPIKSLLVFVNDLPVPHTEFDKYILRDQDIISLITPIAGG